MVRNDNWYFLGGVVSNVLSPYVLISKMVNGVKAFVHHGHLTDKILMNEFNSWGTNWHLISLFDKNSGFFVISKT